MWQNISSEDTTPLSKSLTPSHCIVGGSVTHNMSAIRCETFKESLPHGLDLVTSLLRNGIPLSLQLGSGRAGPSWLEEDGCLRGGLSFMGLVHTYLVGFLNCLAETEKRMLHSTAKCRSLPCPATMGWIEKQEEVDGFRSVFGVHKLWTDR